MQDWRVVGCQKSGEMLGEWRTGGGVERSLRYQILEDWENEGGELRNRRGTGRCWSCVVLKVLLLNKNKRVGWHNLLLQ